MLIHEEIELAKAEMTEKVTVLARGAGVGIAAGIFVVVGLLFILNGFAWLTWYALFSPSTTYFWGFFIVAGVLFLLGALAGFLASRAFKSGEPADAGAGDRRGEADQGDRDVRASGAHDLMPNRTPEEIRASIEANRVELAHSLVRLRGEVAEITDWRGQIAKHQKQVLIGAAVAGFVIGGGIAGVVGLFRRR